MDRQELSWHYSVCLSLPADGRLFPNCSKNSLLPSGESPANAEKAVKPCVICPCLPLWPCPSPLTLRLLTSMPQDSRRYHPIFSLSLHMPFPLPEALLPSFFFQLTIHLQVSLLRSLFLDSLSLVEISLFCTLITPTSKLLSHDLVFACLYPSLDNKPIKSGPFLVLRL